MPRSCDTCSARIPRTAAHNARFCSGACRQKAYRRRSRPLPVELTSRERWVCWEPRVRNGKWTKVPLTVDGNEARVNAPSTWTTFSRARAAATDGRVGIVLGDGLGCIDLDDCISDGKVAPWAQDVIDQNRDEAFLVERSVSGAGVHIFLPMAEAPGRMIRDGEVSVEVYSQGRYIAVTGDRI